VGNRDFGVFDRAIGRFFLKLEARSFAMPRALPRRHVVSSNYSAIGRRIIMETEAAKKLFTVDEYYKMVDAGILREDDRFELIEGEIIQMSSMGSRHAAVVSRLNDVLVPLLKGKALLRPQLPLRLNEFNEPEPDIVVLKPRPDFYASAHPGPADVFLVVEISDSTLKYDRDVKLPIYAAMKLPEVWLADLARNEVLVYRDPSGKRYMTSLTFRSGESLPCLMLPQIQLAVNDALGL
jgi:Uma2 family endonuclease